MRTFFKFCASTWARRLATPVHERLAADHADIRIRGGLRG
jgi:hypothetical protein